jgi:ATP-dependent DNA helicase RecQ
LDHILEESLDDECLEELFEFFTESEDEGLAAALEEFDDAYSEEELRLARIKFLCEVAH